MGIRRQSSQLDSPLDNAIKKMGHRSSAELKIRELLEKWCRDRWPEGRIIHELVTSRGQARADMAVICPQEIIVFEIKGPHDNTLRLIHQCGMFRFVSNKLWLICDENHQEDAELIHFILPSLGIGIIKGLPEQRWKDSNSIEMEIFSEATDFKPHEKMLLSLLWVDELKNQTEKLRLPMFTTHPKLVDSLDSRLTYEQKVLAVCEELRARNFIFRSDSPEWQADKPINTGASQ